jgi:geranylgeranyl diphosphate synthase type I
VNPQEGRPAAAAEELRGQIDAVLREFLAAASSTLLGIGAELAPFAAAIEQFVMDGGKRLRPAFCYWGFRLAAPAGVDTHAVVRAAAALELLHAGALVHDDVIDRSDTRRGAASVHRRFARLHDDAGWGGDGGRFGTGAAILLGDLALVWADTALSSAGLAPAALAAALPLWDAMRTEVMCGQYLDLLEQVRGDSSVAGALRVAHFKSGSYTVHRPLQLGAAMAGAPDRLRDRLADFGFPLGEAFQLRDDLLGVYGDPTVTGKPAGDDLREGKRTVLVALAVQRADAAQRASIDRGLGDASLDDAAVEQLRDVLRATGAVEAVEQLIDDRVAAAHGALQRIAAEDPVDPAAVTALRELTDAATTRSW